MKDVDEEVILLICEVMEILMAVVLAGGDPNQLKDAAKEKVVQFGAFTNELRRLI